MSFLAPLYLLGALAISLPVLFHLIRRMPRGRQEFSTLMFLQPSPPRITRRSRIEHWLLLLLRAAAILLLAAAFARPFFRESASLLLSNEPGRRIAIVIDTSASMRRADLWQQALERAKKTIAATSAADEIGLFAFDESPRLVADWDEPLADAASRRARVESALSSLEPSWGSSDIGRALVHVADRLAAATSEKKHDRSPQIVLISDLQRGANTSKLQAFEWPAEVRLQVEQVAPETPGNASVRLLEDDSGSSWKVRVVNSAGSTSEQFKIEWFGPSLFPSSEGAGSRGTEPISLYVPAGQSRVARMREPPAGADRIRLSGDAHEFDNEFYFAPIQQRNVQIVYVGTDKADDPNGLRYFLDRVWTDTSRRKVSIEAQSPDAPPAVGKEGPAMAVLATAIGDANLPAWQNFVRAGGTALLIVSEPDTATSLAKFTEGITMAKSDEAATKSAEYALFGDIDFRHPVFASFAGPTYNDFTKVRIWKHQRFTIGESAKAQVLARFDNGDPAMWEQTLGTGKVLWLACGWRPGDSQLALSSKFVPLLSSLLDHLSGTEVNQSSGWRVNQPISLANAKSASHQITRPDQGVVLIDASDGAFFEADQPGLFQIQSGDASAQLAVNLDPAESDTAPLAADQLEQLGVRVGTQPTQEERLERQRQMRDIELESRQKVWRWLLVGVLGALALETTLAGRIARKIERAEATS